MVFLGSTSSDVHGGEVRLLPPGLPALLLQRGAEQRGRYVFQPRADASASSSGDRGSSASSAPPSTSASGDTGFRIPSPSPSRLGSWGIGLGAGGAAIVGNPGKAVALMPLGSGKGAVEPNKGKKRVLIMMSNTGGGHKASAEAIKQAFQERHGDKYEIFIVDMWKDHTDPPFNKMPDTYSFLVRHGVLWRMSYELTQPRWFHIPYLRTVGLFMARGLSQAFDHYNPDLIVSVHPLMQHIPLHVLRSRIRSGVQRPVNFATVVTDFTTCHNTWFSDGVTRCFVPTDFCRGLAARNGLAPQQIIQHGLPIRPVFSKRLPGKAAMRKRMGLPPDTPCVLLVGGGEGMGALEATVDELAKRLGDRAQVVTICGRNKGLLERLQAKRYPSGMKVTAVGFVDNVNEWMAASDAVITKAGPGTIAEALIMGLPILLNGNVPCQEEGNIPYVIDNRVGAFETRPDRIAAIVQGWLTGAQQEEFKKMGPRAKALGRPEAVYRIMDDLARLTKELDYSFGPAKAAVGMWAATA